MAELLEPLDEEAKSRVVIIFDNAPYHNSHIVQDYFKEHNIVGLTLPPYCPDLNPVELAINIIKRKV